MAIQCTANDTPKRFARTRVEAFGPYAGIGPVQPPAEPMRLADRVMIAVSVVAVVVVAGLIATGN